MSGMFITVAPFSWHAHYFSEKAGSLRVASSAETLCPAELAYHQRVDRSFIDLLGGHFQLVLHVDGEVAICVCGAKWLF